MSGQTTRTLPNPIARRRNEADIREWRRNRDVISTSKAEKAILKLVLQVMKAPQKKGQVRNLLSWFQYFSREREIISISNFLKQLSNFLGVVGESVEVESLTDDQLAAGSMFGDQIVQAVCLRVLRKRYLVPLESYVREHRADPILSPGVSAESAFTSLLWYRDQHQIDLRGGGFMPLLQFLLWKPIRSLVDDFVRQQIKITDYIVAQYLMYGSEDTRTIAGELMRDKYYAIVQHKTAELRHLSSAAADEAVDKTFVRLEEYSRHHLLRMVNESLGHFLSAICIMKCRSEERTEAKHAALLNEQLNATFIVDHVAGLEALTEDELYTLSNAVKDAMQGANLSEKTIKVLNILAELIISCNGLKLTALETPTTEAVATLLEARGIPYAFNEIETIRNEIRDIISKTMLSCGYVFDESLKVLPRLDSGNN